MLINKKISQQLCTMIKYKVFNHKLICIIVIELPDKLYDLTCNNWNIRKHLHCSFTGMHAPDVS